MKHIRGTLRRLRRRRWDIALLACICAALGILMASELGHRELARRYDYAMQAVSTATRLHALWGGLADAESSERRFALTWSADDLERYRRAVSNVHRLVDQLRTAYTGHSDPDALRAYTALVQGIQTRLGIAGTGLNGIDASLSDRDLDEPARRRAAEEIMANLYDLASREESFVSEASRHWGQILDISRLSIAGATALNVILLVILFSALRRDWRRARERQLRLDRTVRERTRQLGSLASRLQEASEAEKAAMARELHDEFGALLTASKMDLAWVQRQIAPTQRSLGIRIDDVIRMLDQGLLAKRRIVEGLRPSALDYFGICAAARDLCEQVAARAGWRVDLDLPATTPAIDADSELVLYRVLQETLTNAAKHARATEVRVGLKCEPGRYTLEIRDNGTGFDVDRVRARSHGLFGMRHRVEAREGTFCVDSTVGRGTHIRVLLPLRHAGCEPANAADALGARRALELGAVHV